MPEYLYEFVTLITKDVPTEGQISKYILSLRYYHKNDLSSILSFSVLILSCNHLNYQKEVNFSTMEQILKNLLLEADYFSMLLTYCKLLPLLNWAEGRPQREIEETIGPAFRELTRPISSSNLTKANTHQQSRKCLNQHLALLKLLDSKNLFLFFFNLINGTNNSLQNDIDCYFMELASCQVEQEGLISSSQLSIMQKNIELEYGKLRKRKYQEEIVESTYKWLEIELEPMLFEGESQSNHLLMEMLTQVVRTQSNISGATLLQVLDASVESIQVAKVRIFLELVDTCIIEGSYKISIQTILFLVCTIFSKIHSKKLKINGEVIMEHFLLWKEVAIRKQLPVKLIICLIQWLPFLYDKSLLRSQNEPQILQLYRKEILKLANGVQSSEISGLRVLIEELQYRKMEGIYEQMEEFHSQMERPEPKQSNLSNKPSKISQVDFHFKISGLSKSNSQINSLLNSLESVSQNKAKSRNIQLEILSKSQKSGNFGSSNSEKSFHEFVEIIMSLIDLFDYHVKEPSLADQTYTTTKKQSLLAFDSQANSDLLPVVSTHQALSMSIKEKAVDKSKCKIRDLSLNVASYSEQFKKRMVKHRGLIMKGQCIEVGYLIDNQGCRISFFVTFLKPVSACLFRIRENSFKTAGEKQSSFTEPKINVQYQISHKISNLKLYSLEGVANSEKVVRSRLELKITQNRKISEEIYDIPLTIYNLLEWLTITTEDLPNFEQQPCLQTKWHSACPKLIKYGGQYLRKFFPCIRDSKGNYLMKCKFFGQILLARVLLVLAEAKVQVINDGVMLVAMGLLEVIV